jgi:hypothetical protein
MDPGSLIVILILLALFAGALYFGYQKLVVDDVFDLTQEPVEPSTPTEPSAPPSSSDVPGVDSVKGRPLKPTTANKSIHYYAGGGDIVPKGMAKTASVCYEASKARGINNWAWDRKDKRCFAYTDSSLFTVMNNKDYVQDKGRYIIGCTEPGVTVAQGCIDFSGGDKAKGYNSIHHVHFGAVSDGMSLEECRKYLRDQGYDMGMYISDSHWGPHCSYFPNPEDFRGFTGQNNDTGHVTMCSDPSKKVINACQ